MRRFYLLCLPAGACGPALPDVDAELAARRAALGLAQDPFPFADAMAWMEARAVEALLTRRTRDLAKVLARAMVEGEDGKAEATALLTACVECHRNHRRGP